MQAVVYDGKVRLAEVNPPEPKEGEALIEVLTAGICRTDIEITQGYMRFHGVLGHEFVGRVRECSAAPELEGLRVVGEINIAPEAEDDLERRHTPGREVLGIAGRNGCIAELIALPVENLHAVPDPIPDRVAVFVEPLAAALEILEQVDIPPTESVAVLGDGKLGLLVARVLSLRGSPVTLYGRHERKLEIARGYGAMASHADEAPLRAFDLVVDCAGSPDGFLKSLSLLRPRGTLVLKTTTAAPPDFHLAQIVIDEITIVGSRCGPFAPALRLLEAGLVDTEPLIEAVYPLEQGPAALEHATRRGALKVLIEML